MSVEVGYWEELEICANREDFDGYRDQEERRNTR